MKLKYTFALALVFLCTLVASLSVPYGDLDDLQVAKLFAADIQKNSISPEETQGAIISPTPNTTWYVGENVHVVFKKDPEQTVSIFFFDLTTTLAGGPLSESTFSFIVPASAISPSGGTSLLLAVRRQNSYLQAVDSVVVKVLPPK